MALIFCTVERRLPAGAVMTTFDPLRTFGESA
jgi:hypothetical protein